MMWDGLPHLFQEVAPPAVKAGDKQLVAVEPTPETKETGNTVETIEEQVVIGPTPIEVDQTGDTSSEELMPPIEIPMPREEGSSTGPVAEGSSTDLVRPKHAKENPKHLGKFCD